MKNNWNNQKTDDLATAMLSLKNIEEMKRFFRDLLTEQELVEFGNRFQAAKMLDKNIPYTQIEKETGLSSTTIARISKWFKKGMGGYKLVMDRLGENREQSGLKAKTGGAISIKQFHHRH